ncbi:MAG: glycoside hydrolase family 3 N-terminal domain-containing protein [Rhizomicrobium sp.]
MPNEEKKVEAPVPNPVRIVIDEPGVIHPERWPLGESGIARDASMETEIARLLAQMTLEEKVGQTIQADFSSVTPDDVRKYHLGSVLNGGDSGPSHNDRAPAPEWLKAGDAYFNASLPAWPDRPRIPILWGTDSVHGNSNIIGATIFPHNIGLGAMRDPDLVRQIGSITAIETRVTGADWNFAPTVAVVRDVVDDASDGETGLTLALSRPYDVAIVDRMLPKMDGLTVVEEIARAQQRHAGAFSKRAVGSRRPCERA